MSTQITVPSAAETQRHGLMAAHTVAAHIISIAPLPPTMVTSECAPFAPEAPSVSVSFHGSTGKDGVERLAEALSVKAATGPFRPDGSRPYTSFEVLVDGVEVHAWHIGEAAQDSEVPA